MRLFFTILASVAIPVAVHAAYDLTARGAYTWTENLGRASGRANFRDAATYGADITLGTSHQFEPGVFLRPQLLASYNVTPEYDLLDTGEIGPRLTLQKKVGLGPTAPVFSADASVLGRFGRLDESEAVVFKGGVTYTQRINTYVSFSLRGEARADEARSDVYDVCTRDVIGTVFIDPHPRLRFSAGAGHRRGDFVAGASAARYAGALGGALGPDVASYYAATPFTTTDVFEPGWVSYRVRGRADYWFFDLAPALGDNTTLSVRYERAHALNSVGVNYYQDIFRVSVIHVF